MRIIDKSGTGPKYQYDTPIRVIETADEARTLSATLRNHLVAFDLETEGVDPTKESPVGMGRVICFSVAFRSARSRSLRPDLKLQPIPLAERYFIWGEHLELLRDWFQSGSPKIGHNAWGFDNHILANHGIFVNGLVADTLRISKMVWPTKLKHGLKDLMAWYLGYNLGSYKELFSKAKHLGVTTYKRTQTRNLGGISHTTIEGSWDTVSPNVRELIPLSQLPELYPQRLETLYDYATLDAKACLELFYCFSQQWSTSERDCYSRVWNPACKVLFDLERRGVGFDSRVCRNVADGMELERESYLGALHDWVPSISNWNSGKQIARLFYEEKKWPIPEWHGTAKASKRNFEEKPRTDAGAVQWHLRLGLPEVDTRGLETLQQWRALDKLLGGFLSPLPGYVRNGRIHGKFSPHTETGRLASRHPNLQQIPKRDDIRSCFVPAEGQVFVVVDYSQLELYVLAHFLLDWFSDEKLSEDLKAGDVHCQTAKRCWPELLSQKTDEEIRNHHKDRREAAKTINYAVNYGKSAAGLGHQIRDENGNPIGREAAEDLLERYFDAYPAIKSYQQRVQSQVRENGYVETVLGRRRSLEDSPRGYRQALNTPIQGTAADIVMVALLNTAWATPVLQVHDELVFERPLETAAFDKLTITDNMTTDVCDRLQLKVPLKVEAAIKEHW